MKTVVAVHDLSCHAKSSLSVVIPTLAALGVEASILPTALLSTQTDGYEGYSYLDLTGTMDQVLAHWERLGLGFDSIYSGFLGSEHQVDTVLRLISDHHARSLAPLVVVDPVLGDQGVPYGPVSRTLMERMSLLVGKADVITPNLTEAALLLGKRYDPALARSAATEWARLLSRLGPRFVAITSVMEGTDGLVVCHDAKTGEHFTCRQRYAPVTYPGCGDLFASILCALMVNGSAFFGAAQRAATLVSSAVHLSWQAGIEQRKGVAVELIMDRLIEARV